MHMYMYSLVWPKKKISPYNINRNSNKKVMRKKGENKLEYIVLIDKKISKPKLLKMFEVQSRELIFSSWEWKGSGHLDIKELSRKNQQMLERSSMYIYLCFLR